MFKTPFATIRLIVIGSVFPTLITTARAENLTGFTCIVESHSSHSHVVSSRRTLELKPNGHTHKSESGEEFQRFNLVYTPTYHVATANNPGEIPHPQLLATDLVIESQRGSSYPNIAQEGKALFVEATTANYDVPGQTFVRLETKVSIVLTANRLNTSFDDSLLVFLNDSPVQIPQFHTSNCRVN